MTVPVTSPSKTSGCFQFLSSHFARIWMSTSSIVCTASTKIFYLEHSTRNVYSRHADCALLFLGRFGVYQLEICVLGLYGTSKYVASTSSFYFSIALKMIQKRKMQYASPNWTVFDRSCVYAFE